ncbi:hypothetical protein [Microcoleus sp. herbarium2]|uniref:hypothetical protein n=1 Tax=Microcoleus sp. herbarium2 TaxID=3055433 RepID=UPI002FD51328
MYISIYRGERAGFRDCLLQAIMVGETRPYDIANYTIDREATKHDIRELNN